MKAEIKALKLKANDAGKDLSVAANQVTQQFRGGMRGRGARGRGGRGGAANGAPRQMAIAILS